jgi:type II secretion system protein G
MLRVVIIIFALFSVVGCSERSRLERRAIGEGLVDARQVDYWFLNNYPGDVYCGKWDKHNPEMWRDGFKYFIVKDGTANKAPTPDEWGIFCSEDPAKSLYARLGIGPVDAANSDVHKILEDLLILGDALQRYLQDNGGFPSTEQGLEVLLPSQGGTGSSSGENGYLDALPKDPWGRPYQYAYSQLGGAVATLYSVYTLGADGEKGGKDENVDINNGHLRFLKHIVNLL